MVMTRSFTSMLLVVLQLAASQNRCAVRGYFFDRSRLPPRSLLACSRLTPAIESFVCESLLRRLHLSRARSFPSDRTRGAALKITEMSCCYAQAYHTLEFRHGPRSHRQPRKPVLHSS